MMLDLSFDDYSALHDITLVSSAVRSDSNTCYRHAFSLCQQPDGHNARLRRNEHKSCHNNVMRRYSILNTSDGW
jgi:hypothetical protein